MLIKHELFRNDYVLVYKGKIDIKESMQAQIIFLFRLGVFVCVKDRFYGVCATANDKIIIDRCRLLETILGCKFTHYIESNFENTIAYIPETEENKIILALSGWF